MRWLKLLFNTKLKIDIKVLIPVFSGIYVATVLWITLVSRDVGKNQVYLIPFLSYYKIFQGNFRVLFENCANIFLFIPCGMCIYCFFQKDVKQTVLIGFACSLFIEILQLLTSLGSFEVDDLIHNTIGVILGWYILKRLNYSLAIVYIRLVLMVMISMLFTLSVLWIGKSVFSVIHHNRMIEYAHLNDTENQTNLLVLNGYSGYIGDSNVYIRYQNAPVSRFSTK